jgi:glutathione-regulated potassium-efflux system ancillary protein KefG
VVTFQHKKVTTAVTSDKRLNFSPVYVKKETNRQQSVAMNSDKSTSLPNVLLVFAHPNIRHSRANKALLTAAQSLPNVVIHDIYHRYPHSYIDIPTEQAALQKADIVVLQHPFYWYSVPSLLKEWIDSTLTSGWAFGKDGVALKGKCWAHAISTGGEQDNYTDETRMGIQQLLLPLEKTAALCHTRWQEPFLLFDADKQTDEQLQAHASSYIRWLESLK